MKRLVFTVLLLGMLTACSFPQPKASPSDSQTQIALFAAATLTKAAVEAQAQQTPTQISFDLTNTEVPTEAPTQPAPTAVPPTVTTVPTAAVTPIPPTSVPTAAPTAIPAQGTQLKFAPGTTNTIATGSLAAEATKRYVFWADKGQVMDISCSGAYISVTAPNGKRLVNFDQRWTWYRDYISEKGNWTIDIKAGSFDTNYSLYLGIPQRLSFAANTSSLTAKATIPSGKVHNFIFWGNKGQTLTVNVAPGEHLTLAIWHVNGTEVLSVSSKASSFLGTLPEAGDYVIDVYSSSTSSVEVSLDLSIK